MEATVEQKLKALYNLQLIDSKVDDIRRMRGELPMEVKDLEDEIAGLETRIRKYEDEQNEFEDGIAHRRAFIKESTSLKEKYEQQINNVKNSREYDALSKEIELQTLEMQIADKKIKELMALIGLKKDEIGVVRETLEGRQKDLVAKRAELDTIIGETEREEHVLADRSRDAERAIDQRLLAAYKRIRSNARNGLGVVPITRDSCGGCFNKIPPQRQLDIRQRKKVIVCEYCGRILVDQEMPAEVENALTPLTA